MTDLGRGSAGIVYLIGNFVAVLTLAASPYFGILAAVIISSAVTYLVILIHELGHAGAVLWLKGRVLIFAVGPLAARFYPFKLVKTPDMEGDDRELGGFVMSTFDGHETTRKDLIVAVAGPVANLLFAAALGLALAWTAPAKTPATTLSVIAVQQGQPSNAPFHVARPLEAEIERSLQQERAKRQAGALWIPLISAMIVLSVAAGIANLIPFSGSDGDAVRRAFRDMTEARRHAVRRDAG